MQSRRALFAIIIGLSLVLAFPLTATARYGDVTRWLSFWYGGDGLNAIEAYVDEPSGFTSDSNCTLTIADTNNNVIRQINGQTNVITTLAGSGKYGSTDGALRAATFRAPQDVDRDADGNFYVTETNNSTIRAINGSTVRTWITGLRTPTASTVDGPYLYISDTGYNRILRATIPNGAPVVLTNIASPGKMAVLGTKLYVFNAKGTKFSAVDTTSGVITDISTGLSDGGGVTIYQDKVYFDSGPKGGFNKVWVYDPATGDVTRLLNVQEDVDFNHASDILFCNDTLYLLSAAGGSVYTRQADMSNPQRIAGKDRYGNQDGSRSVALLGRPKSFALSKDSKTLYILENHKVRKFSITTGQVSTIAGHSNDNFREGVGDRVRFSGPTQMVLSYGGSTLYIADRNNNRIRTLNVNTKTSGTLSGAGMINGFAGQSNGYAEGRACNDEQRLRISGCAYFNRPMGLAISPDGRWLYVADSANHRIRRVDTLNGNTSLIAGSGTAGLRDGVGSAARFNTPVSLAISRDGRTLYVVDQANHAVRQIVLSTKRVTTLTGNGRIGYREGTFFDARLALPDSIALGPGNTLLLSEVGSQRIRMLDLTARRIKLIAGSGQRGNANGTSTRASFNNPRGLILFNRYYVLVADQLNDVIRAISLR